MGRGYSYIDGSTKKPANETKLARRETHDAQIISWILGFVKPNNILESLAALEKIPAPILDVSNNFSILEHCSFTDPTLNPSCKSHPLPPPIVQEPGEPTDYGKQAQNISLEVDFFIYTKKNKNGK